MKRIISTVLASTVFAGVYIPAFGAVEREVSCPGTDTVLWDWSESGTVMMVTDAVFADNVEVGAGRRWAEQEAAKACFQQLHVYESAEFMYVEHGVTYWTGPLVGIGEKCADVSIAHFRCGL